MSLPQLTTVKEEQITVNKVCTMGSNIEDLKKFRSDIDEIARKEHENVVRIVCPFDIEKMTYGTEFCELGTLKQFLLDNASDITEIDIVQWAIDIIEGIRHLHSICMRHIFIGTDQVYLFKSQKDNLIRYKDNPIRCKVFPLFRINGSIASVEYNIFELAPEQIQNTTTCTENSLVYSAGMIFCMMLTCTVPLAHLRSSTSGLIPLFLRLINQSTINDLIATIEVPKFDSWIKMITEMFLSNPSKRPTLYGIHRELHVLLEYYSLKHKVSMLEFQHEIMKSLVESARATKESLRAHGFIE